MENCSVILETFATSNIDVAEFERMVSRVRERGFESADLYASASSREPCKYIGKIFNSLMDSETGQLHSEPTTTSLISFIRGESAFADELELRFK